MSSWEVMDSPENVVCFFVMTSSFPPAFDHSPIVPKYFEVFSRRADCDEIVDKKLEANSFCPSNVLPLSFPPREEAPSSPSSIPVRGR